MSETRILQRDYWAALDKALVAGSNLVRGGRKPQPQSWMSYPIGRSRFHLGAVMLRPKNQIRTELYLSGGQAKAHFNLLLQQRDAIDAELGYALDWEELPEGQDSRVSCTLANVNPEDQTNWPAQHAWLVKSLNDMHRVFAQRVKLLNADDWQPDPSGLPDA